MIDVQLEQYQLYQYQLTPQLMSLSSPTPQLSSLLKRCHPYHTKHQLVRIENVYDAM